MADRRIIILFASDNMQLDIVAGLNSWVNHGGYIKFAGLNIVKPLHHVSHSEYVSIGYEKFDRDDLDTLKPIIDQNDVHIVLSTSWYSQGISLTSYHLARPSVMILSLEDAWIWDEAAANSDFLDNAFFALAHGARAAYALSTVGIDYKQAIACFDRDAGRFSSSNESPQHARGLCWIDVCNKLGGVEPTGHVEADRMVKPFGYIRHTIAGIGPV